MDIGPKIAQIASLVGDPARANMLACLMDGRALTASKPRADAPSADAHAAQSPGTKPRTRRDGEREGAG